MKTKIGQLSKRMGRATSEQPLTAGQSLGTPKAFPHGVDEQVVVTTVRRLGYVALRVFETIQGNLISSDRHELAETLNDTLKPLVDMLVHFELPRDTEVDNGPV